MRGSVFLRDTRCVVAHPTATNCFIESGLGSTSSPKTDDETQRSRRSQQAKMRARVGGVGFSHSYYLIEKPFQKSFPGELLQYKRRRGQG